jgi:hypothetical protein
MLSLGGPGGCVRAFWGISFNVMVVLATALVLPLLMWALVAVSDCRLPVPAFRRKVNGEPCRSTQRSHVDLIDVAEAVQHGPQA